MLPPPLIPDSSGTRTSATDLSPAAILKPKSRLTKEGMVSVRDAVISQGTRDAGGAHLSTLHQLKARISPSIYLSMIKKQEHNKNNPQIIVGSKHSLHLASTFVNSINTGEIILAFNVLPLHSGSPHRRKSDIFAVTAPKTDKMRRNPSNIRPILLPCYN
ncbi:hypothetical protein E2C01_002070 [Portunus trituberculatus]|uniref:Uncharacterized protein n=1 Tax=Portunus trituberculatus TaxID=210409 RepID=A0A5B7CIS2_PORTR|nr:hypothetical protein [Portunus trituberculatus]